MAQPDPGELALALERLDAADSDALGVILRVIEHQLADMARMRAALEHIAAPVRRDGSWNRDREACRQLAEQALHPNA